MALGPTPTTIRLGRTKPRYIRHAKVSSWAEASAAATAYIQEHDLGAGCSDRPAFIGGQVFAGDEPIGRISYNGRAWDLEGQEIAL